MIEKYAHKNNIEYEIIETTEFITVLRLGIASSKVKSLEGIHKLTRVSPFGKGDKLHTSLAKIVINGPKEKITFAIKECDVRMDFFKATGPGGQHRNKTMSAVRLVHVPTNIVVTSSSSRSQHDNRRYAYEQLQCKLEDLWDNKQKQNILRTNVATINKMKT
jgi:protein subunit release factor B